jgi:hypothetical protein
MTDTVDSNNYGYDYTSSGGADYGSNANDYGYDYTNTGSNSNSIDLYSDWWGSTSTGSTSTGSTGIAAPGTSGANTGGANWWDSVSKWLTEGTGPKKTGPSVLSMSMPAVVSGGLAALGELFTGKQAKMAKMAQQRADAETMNAQSNAARTAQQSYGNSVPKIKKPTGGLMYHQVAVNRPKVQGVA